MGVIAGPLLLAHPAHRLADLDSLAQPHRGINALQVRVTVDPTVRVDHIDRRRAGLLIEGEIRVLGECLAGGDDQSVAGGNHLVAPIDAADIIPRVVVDGAGCRGVLPHHEGGLVLGLRRVAEPSAA